MKRHLYTSALVLVSLLAASLAMAAPKAGKAPKAAATSVHGIVKGAPTGKTFTVAKKGGTVTEDAAKAKIRTSGGKFASFKDICAGAMVTAKGTMGGTCLIADEVQVFPKKPAKGKK